jgi:CheY-like chemotaxis protein
MSKLIMIVEDDASLVQLYEVIFRLTGLDLRTEVYMDGQKAYDRVQREPDPKVIILDLHLPHVQGGEIFEAARKNMPNTNIVVVSADILAANDMLSRADRVFVKPIDVIAFQHYMVGLVLGTVGAVQ